jgi:hypothetical protein
MRIHKLLPFLILLTANCIYAQVGINTTSPQEALHVAGDITSNIKIEGLNAINNLNNLGIGNSTRVYVDGEGDLTLASSEQNIEIVLDFGNYLPDTGTSIQQTGGGSAFTFIPSPNVTFTLTKNAIVQVNYSVSWRIDKNANGKIDDMRARIIQTGVYLVNAASNTQVLNDLNGNPINPGTTNCNAQGDLINCLGTSGLIGLSGQYYNNSNSSAGENRGYHNTGTDYVRLPAGTYRASFAVQVSVGETNGVGNINFNLGTADDDIQVIAYYYN